MVATARNIAYICHRNNRQSYLVVGPPPTLMNERLHNVAFGDFAHPRLASVPPPAE
jgi:hypothetical protein